MSNLVIDSEIIQNIENKVYRDNEFRDCEFISTDYQNPNAKCNLYNSRFINCIFRDCTIDVVASYSAFIGCKFINCKFGGRKHRNNYSVFFRCNFDNSTIDTLTGAKMKRCSFNGAVIESVEDAIFVKCSDKYIKIIKTGKNVTRVNMGNLVKKIVTTAAKKPKNGKIKTVRFNAETTLSSKDKGSDIPAE